MKKKGIGSFDLKRNGNELPLGLGMALAQNKAAMERFAALPEEKKTRIVEMAREVNSKEEMRALVTDFIEKGKSDAPLSFS